MTFKAWLFDRIGLRRFRVVALHTAGPGLVGDQSTHAPKYPGYAPVRIARDHQGAILFPGELFSGYVGAAPVTHFSVGYGDGKFFVSAPVTPPLAKGRPCLFNLGEWEWANGPPTHTIREVSPGEAS